MAPVNDAETQFKFLISCIKHSTAGKVDFQAVATEMEIVSKAAAAKRYERLLKAHDASPKKAPADGGSGGEETPAKKTRTPRKRAAAKISKAEPADEDEDVKDEFKDDSESDMKSKKKKGKRNTSDESAYGADDDEI